MAEKEPVVTAPHGLAGAPKQETAVGGAPLGGASRCPSCNQHFTGDARFCPFDGGALAAAPGYRAAADPLVGTLVDGRYEVETVLGEGGMGVVYVVRHRSLDKRFALKVMRAEMARDNELAARFIQEARAAAAIFHPNVVQITDFGELPNDAPYFVMELLDGAPLSKLLKMGGPPPFARALRILKQVAAALGAAHSAGVVHRDLKPDNIHVTSNDVVKVLDFGVAKVAGAGRLTRTGMVYGTPHYMSPEQASGDDVDHRADIYALGIIMYEMFAGRVPFEADSYMGVLTKHMFMLPEPPSRVNAAVRELGALEDVTLKCLEKKPHARYPSMEALLAEIESIAQVGAGGQLEILRARSDKDVRAGVNLADELEPPAREEMSGLLRSAGVPVAIPRGFLLGGVAIAILALGVGYARLRPHGVAAENPPGVLGATSAGVSAVPHLQPRPEATIAAKETSYAEPTTPDPTVSTAPTASSPVRQERPGPPRTAPGRSVPRGHRVAPAASHSGFGMGDIVNPWSK
ncbi:MAG TPA: serine/threonine-protein kinase [Polyangiaceae bacterium]|jgi:serine/threonine-protein kinase|nr:serine/threonine-protein kinase [Polyangiaceae bacterium]